MPIRPYNQDQVFLLPPSLDEWVRADHPARVFSEIIDRLDNSQFREPKDEGRPAYHSAMLLKVLLWGYATGVRSSRKIEERLQQDIVFMWLAGMEKPDFRTLCLFRSGNKEAIEKIFVEVIMIAQAMGMGSLGLVALDGSKVRANSGIDTFKKVEDWKRALVEARAEAGRILEEAESIDKAEDAGHGQDRRGDELPAEVQTAQKRIEKIDALIKKAAELGKDETARMSSTDPEASFMHTRNSSSPAYNAQLAVTDDQIIVYAEVTTEPVDVNQTKRAVETIQRTMSRLPKILLADTGYSGGENLRYLEEKEIDAYIPESGERHIGKTTRARAHLYGKESFQYRETEGCYICPLGKPLWPVSQNRLKTKYSSRSATIYRAERGVCAACPAQKQCTANTTIGRSISRDGYEEYREQMKEKIHSPEGKKIYGKRKCLVEPVFGQLKTRGSFVQFLLRGLEKVKIEWKITATAHNLLKIIGAIMKKEQMYLASA
jgi:transposase